MKYTPKKVYVKENDNFIEITNEEHESRKATDEQYAKRWFVPLQGCLLEVDEQFYIEYYKEYERNRYLAALDRKNRILSIEAFDTEDENGVDFIVDEDEDVEKQVTDKLMAEKLRSVLLLLSEDEQLLIQRHYYENIPETELAKIYGITQQAISKKMIKIRAKLKNLIENYKIWL